jgi:nucleoside-diphosphate-sugar epimerase
VEAQCALVTGATGFVGRALVARLRADGVSVRGISRTSHASLSPSTTKARLDFVVADLSEGSLEPNIVDGVDVIYHLAAKTHDVREGPGAEAEYRRLNVTGTERLHQALRPGSIRRFVLASSVKAVDEGGGEQIEETVVPRPITAYGRSKRAAEELVMRASESLRFEPVCLRFPLVYGPGQRGNLQRMMAAIEAGRFPPPPSNGNRRSLLHLDNAVEALLLAGRHPAAAGQVYFVTDATAYSTRAIYDAIRSALGLRTKAWAVPEPAFRVAALAGDLLRALTRRRVGFDSDALQKLLGSAWYSSAKIERELGYRPERDLFSSMPGLVAGHKALHD